METTNEFQWNVWVANTLGNLIASAHQQHSPLPRETIKKAKAVFVNKCSDGDVLAFGQLTGVSKSKITQWYSGATIPMLDKLLKICDRLKISLVEFFQEGILPLSTTISNQAAFSPRSLPRQPTLTSLLNKRRVRNLLRGVLHQNEYPSPSVREVARRYHVSLATFYRYAPDLCKAISARYWDYKKLLQLQAIQRGRNELKRLVPELYAQGITPSVKNLASVMTNPEALWYEEVLETLSELRRSLGELPEI